MTLAEAAEILSYWEQSPPVHLMLQAIARLLGWSPPPATDAAIEAITAAPPPGLAIARGGGLGMPPPLDVDALRARNRERAAAMERTDRTS